MSSTLSRILGRAALLLGAGVSGAGAFYICLHQLLSPPAPKVQGFTQEGVRQHSSPKAPVPSATSVSLTWVVDPLQPPSLTAEVRASSCTPTAASMAEEVPAQGSLTLCLDVARSQASLFQSWPVAGEDPGVLGGLAYRSQEGGLRRLMVAVASVCDEGPCTTRLQVDSGQKLSAPWRVEDGAGGSITLKARSSSEPGDEGLEGEAAEAADQVHPTDEGYSEL